MPKPIDLEPTGEIAFVGRSDAGSVAWDPVYNLVSRFEKRRLFPPVPIEDEDFNPTSELWEPNLSGEFGVYLIDSYAETRRLDGDLRLWGADSASTYRFCMKAGNWFVSQGLGGSPVRVEEVPADNIIIDLSANRNA